ncbi:MAG: prepilin-type N-terminal cleavage/methylation domain-containing protein [Candidatus Omnitrophica bacterium]|jgi:prepilin-type N-terminal cleavage/methylation domain-containing protein|nr:prepilin-type N-terminal cleavage/methylation domain-containing protein [Candidatus Omnitrophota bacterium]
MKKALKGFTLIELLISVSIFSLIAVVMYACFGSGITAYKRILQEAAFGQKLRFALSVIDKDFRNACFSKSIDFRGDEKRLSLASLADDGGGTNFGVARISYGVEGSGNEFSLVRRIEPLRQAASAVLAEKISGKEALGGRQDGYEVLLDSILDIKFSYLYLNEGQASADSAGNPNDGRSSYEWVALWQEDALPIAVSMEIVYLNPNSLKTHKIIKRVKVPVAGPLHSGIVEV